MRSLGFTMSVIFCVLLFIQCDSGKNNNSNNQSKLNIVKGPDMPINLEKESRYASLAQVRNQASMLLDSRIAKDGDPAAMVTSPYWIWAGFFNGSEMIMPHQLKGQWIKFDDDFTYKYGHYDDINGSGRYHYRMMDDSFIMMDDNEAMQPKEFKLQSNGIAIVLVGRHGFEINNGMQMKLSPRDVRPTRK